MDNKKSAYGGLSKFAALEIEEISDEETSNPSIKPDQKKSNAERNAKKKARKKKKTAVDHQLRDLAFSKPVSTKVIQHVHQQRHTLNGHSADKDDFTKTAPINSIHTLNTNHTESESWEEWKNKDEEFVVDQFQKDLAAAVRNSEEDRYRAQKNIEKNSQHTKKKKQPTISLDEFHSMHDVKPAPSLSLSAEDFSAYKLKGYCPDELDPFHFQLDIPLDEHQNMTYETLSSQQQQQSNKKKTTKKKKQRNTNKEKLEDLNKHHKESKDGVVEQHNETKTVDNISMLIMDNKMAEKDSMIQSLTAENESLTTELNRVKKRNKQLCFILGEGEMKEKSEILVHVEKLLKNEKELSEELTGLHTLLEQERSKVTTLKLELSKYQNQRTKHKSISEDK